MTHQRGTNIRARLFYAVLIHLISWCRNSRCLSVRLTKVEKRISISMLHLCNECCVLENMHIVLMLALIIKPKKPIKGLFLKRLGSWCQKGGTCEPACRHVNCLKILEIACSPFRCQAQYMSSSSVKHMTIFVIIFNNMTSMIPLSVTYKLDHLIRTRATYTSYRLNARGAWTRNFDPIWHVELPSGAKSLISLFINAWDAVVLSRQTSQSCASR